MTLVKLGVGLPICSSFGENKFFHNLGSNMCICSRASVVMDRVNTQVLSQFVGDLCSLWQSSIFKLTLRTLAHIEDKEDQGDAKQRLHNWAPLHRCFLHLTPWAFHHCWILNVSCKIPSNLTLLRTFNCGTGIQRHYKNPTFSCKLPSNFSSQDIQLWSRNSKTDILTLTNWTSWFLTELQWSGQLGWRQQALQQNGKNKFPTPRMTQNSAERHPLTGMEHKDSGRFNEAQRIHLCISRKSRMATTNILASIHPIMKSHMYLQSIKRLRLIGFIKDLITRALERQCAKQNVKRSAQATSNQQLAALEDKNIVTSFSSIILCIIFVHIVLF